MPRIHYTIPESAAAKIATATLLDLVLADPHCTERGILSDLWAECPELRPEVDLRGAEVVYRDDDAVPWGIRCDMWTWCEDEGPCEHCDGCGDLTAERGCYYCRGSGIGRIESLAARVCRVWPVVNVVLVDRKPFWRYEGEPCRWFDWDAVGAGSKADEQMTVSRELFLILLEEKCGNRTDKYRIRNIPFNSEQEAHAALSHAALALGRQRAGLPPLV